MKVTQNPIPTNAGLENTKATGARAKAPETSAQRPGAGSHDPASVAISDTAHMMQQAREIAHSASPTPTERVAELKQRIKEGTYRVDNAAVADRLVDEHLASHFGKNDL